MLSNTCFRDLFRQNISKQSIAYVLFHVFRRRKKNYSCDVHLHVYAQLRNRNPLWRVLCWRVLGQNSLTEFGIVVPHWYFRVSRYLDPQTSVNLHQNDFVEFLLLRWSFSAMMGRLLLLLSCSLVAQYLTASDPTSQPTIQPSRQPSGNYQLFFIPLLSSTLVGLLSLSFSRVRRVNVN